MDLITATKNRKEEYIEIIAGMNIENKDQQK